MAKFKDLKIVVDGHNQIVRVNVNTSGQFTFKCMTEGTDRKLNVAKEECSHYDTFLEVETLIKNKTKEYADSEAVYSTILCIMYRTTGKFNNDKEFAGYRSSSDIDNRVELDYDVKIREVRNGQVTVYQRAKNISTLRDFELEHLENKVGQWVRSGDMCSNRVHYHYTADKFIEIPYTEALELTIKKAIDNIAKISHSLEVVFGKQPEELITFLESKHALKLG